MIPAFNEKTALRAPASVVSRLPGGTVVALDPAAPHWVATDERGLDILARLDGRTPLDEVVTRYAAESRLDATRAWLHVDTLVRDALRHGFITTDGAVPQPYLGRAAYLQADRQYLDPFNNLLFFAAWPMLAACFALYLLRDLDTK